jgi:DNA-binding NtrC family response regulator
MSKQEKSLLRRQASVPVLVIEDDGASRELLGTVLEGGGYPVVCVDSKTDILRRLSGSKVLGIVSGVRSIDGVDFAAWLSQHLPDLIQRVVLAGNASSKKDRSQMGPAGWPLIQAPFQPKRLLSLVAKVMGEPQPTERVLVSDDEESIREILVQMLGLGGFRCRSFAGGGQALELLDSGERFDLMTSDLLNSPRNGTWVLEQMRDKYPEIPVLIVSTVQDSQVAVQCIRNGAYDYLPKPFEREQFLICVRRALEYRRLKMENNALRIKLTELSNRKPEGRKARR